MLEGLEAVEIQFSELLEEYNKMRIDAEFFKKDYVKYLNRIRKKGVIKIGDVSFVTDGIHESIDFDSESRINLISAKSPKENFFDLSSNHHISETQHLKNPRTSLQKDDVIISTVGTIGNCAVVNENILPANSDRHVGIVRLKEKILPYFLSTFILSKYGRFQTFRESTGNVQLNLFIYKIKEIVVPDLSLNFQKEIECICRKAFTNRQSSFFNYTQAETLLLQNLGLADFSPSTEAVNIKSFSESFGSSGRLDAEYYQKKYEDHQSLIHSYPNGYEAFSVACELKDKNFNPEDKTEYKYIELSNIGKSGEITDCTTALGEELPTRARRKVETNDVVISSIEGSLESCALVTSEYDNALCSTGFFIVNSKKLNSETLLVLFKSKPMQALLKKGCSGTILTAISKTELEQIPIPLIDANTQNKIKTLINESFKLKKQSEHLLEVAKTAVEIAIEQDEITAIRDIDENNL